MPLPLSTLASIHLFRRDEKDRIAAIDTGVTPQDFTPVTILDPGPDGIPGTFDDHSSPSMRRPATLGHDHYLLTNPPGLRTSLRRERATAHGLARHHGVGFLRGGEIVRPNHPGNAIFENDPGVVGALFSDPNTDITRTAALSPTAPLPGRSRRYIDCPRAGAACRFRPWPITPTAWRSRACCSSPDCRKGRSCGHHAARQSRRGNRAEHVQNWNLRLSREWPLAFGELRPAADLLNVTNADLAIQQADLTGLAFNSRYPSPLSRPVLCASKCDTGFEPWRGLPVHHPGQSCLVCRESSRHLFLFLMRAPLSVTKKSRDDSRSAGRTARATRLLRDVHGWNRCFARRRL